MKEAKNVKCLSGEDCPTVPKAQRKRLITKVMFLVSVGRLISNAIKQPSMALRPSGHGSICKFPKKEQK